MNKANRIKFLNKKRIRKQIDIENESSANKRIKIKTRIINRKSDKVTPKDIKKKQTPTDRRRRILKEKYENNFSIEEDSLDDGSESEADSNKESPSSEDDSESYSPSSELVDKINELVFSKIEMPSSTSNKSILGALEHIESLLDKIDQSEIYEVKFNILFIS